MMRIVIAGSRSYYNFEEAESFIRECLQNMSVQPPLILLSGGASGADQLGERFAVENGFSVEHHFAQWQRFGKSAGPKRNQEMAELCDAVICFWDGKSKGTASLILCAKKLKKPVFIKII